MFGRICLMLLVLGMVSCEHTEDLAGELGSNSTIIGTWIESDLDEASYVETHLMRRVEELAQDRYGFIVKDDGTFVERKNAGWCATPPISYANFEGEWKALSDSLLKITVGYWGGTMSYEMQIVSLEGDLLEVDFIYEGGE